MNTTKMTQKKSNYLLWIGSLLCVLIAVFISLQQYSFNDVSKGIAGNRINNYLIFKHSFGHLIHGNNLYILDLSKHLDLYKYAPFFAMCMAPFYAIENDEIGICLWNFLNIFVFFISVYQQSSLNQKQKIGFLLMTLPEVLISMQYFQSNVLIAGLCLLAIESAFNQKTFKGPLWIGLSTAIKLFGGIFFLLFFFIKGNSNKLKFFLYALVIGLIILLSPALITGIDGLVFQYKEWLKLLASDQNASSGFSIVGILDHWFNLQPNKNLVTLLGVILLMPLLFNKNKDDVFLYGFSGLMLLWMIIFNHKSESPTMILAASGFGLVYLALRKSFKEGGNKALNLISIIALIGFIGFILFSSDLLSFLVKNHYQDFCLTKTMFYAIVFLIGWIWLIGYKQKKEA